MGSAIGAAISVYGQQKQQDYLSNEAGHDATQAALEMQKALYDQLRGLFTGPEFAQSLIEGIMGRGGEGAILDFLFQPPVKMTDAEKREYSLFQQSEPMAADVVKQLQGLSPYVDELLKTGYKTDIQPIIDAETYRLNTDTAPGLAERFGGAISGSGFEQALNKAASDVSMFLGEKEYDANEAAAGRRVAGLNAAPELYASPLNLQTGFAEALGAAGERYRLRKQATRPSNIGANILQALGVLAPIEQGQGFLQGGFPGMAQGGLGSSALGAALGGLGGGLGSLAQGLGKVNWGSLFGGGGSTFGGSDFGGAAGYPYGAGGIGGTGVTDAGFDAIYAAPAAEVGSSSLLSGGGFSAIA